MRTEPSVIQTVFTYRDGGFKDKQEIIKPTGYVQDVCGGAVWGCSPSGRWWRSTHLHRRAAAVLEAKGDKAEV